MLAIDGQKRSEGKGNDWKRRKVSVYTAPGSQLSGKDWGLEAKDASGSKAAWVDVDQPRQITGGQQERWL